MAYENVPGGLPDMSKFESDAFNPDLISDLSNRVHTIALRDGTQTGEDRLGFGTVPELQAHHQLSEAELAAISIIEDLWGERTVFDGIVDYYCSVQRKLGQSHVLFTRTWQGPGHIPGRYYDQVDYLLSEGGYRTKKSFFVDEVTAGLTYLSREWRGIQSVRDALDVGVAVYKLWPLQEM